MSSILHSLLIALLATTQVDLPSFPWSDGLRTRDVPEFVRRGAQPFRPEDASAWSAPERIGLDRGGRIRMITADPEFRIDRPLVLVEGIDFEGATGLDELQDALWETDLLPALTDLGFDLFLVDFRNSGRAIFENGDFVGDVLSWIDETYRATTWPDGIVVVGFSLGGVVARDAVFKYERQDGLGIRLPILLLATWDAPHQGADIPPGLLATVDFWARDSRSARRYLDQLMNPASRDILIRSPLYRGDRLVGVTDSFHRAFIEAYVQRRHLAARQIALTNGSLQGMPLGTGEEHAPRNAFELSHRYTFLGIPWARMSSIVFADPPPALAPRSGPASHDPDDGGGVSAIPPYPREHHRPQDPSPADSSDASSGLPTDSLEWTFAYNRLSAPFRSRSCTFSLRVPRRNLDRAPGGFRPTFRILQRQLNLGWTSGIADVRRYLLFTRGRRRTLLGQPFHTLVPTVSALDLQLCDECPLPDSAAFDSLPMAVGSDEGVFRDWSAFSRQTGRPIASFSSFDAVYGVLGVPDRPANHDHSEAPSGLAAVLLCELRRIERPDLVCDESSATMTVASPGPPSEPEIVPAPETSGIPLGRPAPLPPSSVPPTALPAGAPADPSMPSPRAGAPPIPASSVLEGSTQVH